MTRYALAFALFLPVAAVAADMPPQMPPDVDVISAQRNSAEDQIARLVAYIKKREADWAAYSAPLWKDEAR